MRVTPIALAYLGDENACLESALSQASITHFDPAAGWGAAVAALAVRRMILGEPFEDALSAALGFLPADQLQVFGPLLAEGWDPAQRTNAAGERLASNGSVWVCLAQAVWAVRNHGNFHDVVTAAIDLGGDTDTVACVAGALAGARWSIQGIPSRWVAYIHGTVASTSGDRLYRNHDLQNLALRLIGSKPPRHTEFVQEIGPTEILDGLWAADIQGASRTPEHFAVVSMALTRGLFHDHPVRREFYLVDQEGDANTDADAVLTDALDTIDALLADGHQVVVHCHAGRSRTGLVLKGHVMRRLGLSEREAHRWVQERWPWCADWNATFRELLQRNR